jgi:hypothetical protein
MGFPDSSAASHAFRGKIPAATRPFPALASPDFIEVIEGALSPDACRAIVARFEASGIARRGETGSGVDATVKDSWDIPLHAQPGWQDVEQLLNDAVLGGFRAYLRRYPHVAIAPMRLELPDPATGRKVALDAEGLRALDDAMLNAVILMLFRPGTINLQKYIAGQGGYPYWHCELYPHPGFDNGESLHRVVLWTIYLNDGFEGGETEFLYQERKVAPRAGTLLIAPTAFTHTHRGNMPRNGDKYIATSWILFRRAESMYGPPPGAAGQ